MASNGLELSVYRVLMPDGSGFRDLLCVVPHEWGFEKGLPGEAIVGTLLTLDPRLVDPEGSASSISPENFAVNSVFRELFHEIVGRYAPDQPGFEDEARRQGNGYVYVLDSRTPDPAGRVPSEDIVGGFEVRGGVIVPGAYTPNPEFRFVGENGLFTLSGFLAERLLEEIVRRSARG